MKNINTPTIKTISRGLLISVCLGLASTTFVLTACGETAQQEGTGQYVDSSVTTTKVKTALLAQSDLHSTNISVITRKGVVTLSGHVDSATQSSLAEKTVKDIAGVKKVNNNLTYGDQD